MAAKIYLLSESWFGYDEDNHYDEYYYKLWSTTLGAFTFRELADKLAKEKSLEKLRAKDAVLFSVYINVNEIDHKTKRLQDEFRQSHFLSENYNFNKPLTEVPDKTILEVLDYFKIQLFEVTEVPLLA